MNKSLREFVDSIRPQLLDHLKNDILPFWSLPEVLGSPVGNFPTYINQCGKPDLSKPKYVRMHGRQTYAYFAAYQLVHSEKLLNYGFAGLKKLKEYENPLGGYYSQISPYGTPLMTPITIQDQCYSFFPTITAYKLTSDRAYLEKIWQFIDFIDHGPYRKGLTYCDSLMPDLSTCSHFKTDLFNLVSVVDFLNVILIPALQITPNYMVSTERKEMLIKWLDLLVEGYWGDGIFWNDPANRSDWNATHVDFGHTSKAYGIVFEANKLLTKWKMPLRHIDIMEIYPKIVIAASNSVIGWRTDFENSAFDFKDLNLSWWRHVLIDQTVFRYAEYYPELVPLLDIGLRAWFRCEYIDRTRACRGVRDSLKSNGEIASDDDNLDCKANPWKNAYHEVDHVLTLCAVP